MKLFTILLTLLGATFANAQTQTLSTKADTGVADHVHFFNSGIRSSKMGSGLTVGYSYRIGSRLLVGLGGSFANQDDSKEGGSLDAGQYYRDEYNLKTTTAELNTTFFFKEDGYGKWGFLMRAGVGHGWHKAEGKWSRYDRNPAFIILFGDDKRLREQGSDKREWESTYAKVGGYYQMLWGFKEGNRVGHVLELGVEAQQFDRSRKVAYTKPNGQSKSEDIDATTAALQFQYTVAF